MFARPFSIELEACEDSENKIYYHGAKKSPCQIDCRDGVAFMIFTSEEGAEELQIACVDPDAKFGRWYRTHDGIKINLKAREDKDKKIFYLGKIQFDGFIDFKRGGSFRVFTSREGEEQLQIRAYIKFLHRQDNYHSNGNYQEDREPNYSEQDADEVQVAS